MAVLLVGVVVRRQSISRSVGSRDRDTKQLWNLSVPVIRGYLTNKSVPQADKVHVALELVKKLAPSVLDLTGDLPLVQFVSHADPTVPATVVPRTDESFRFSHS